MTVRRLFIFMLLPIMLLLLWSVRASAQESTQKVLVPEGGECKIDDSYKRQLAQEAYTAVYNARNAYMQYVKILKNDYEAEGGVCHNLYSSWKHNGLNALFSGGLEGANQLSWTDADRKGAEVVDSGQYKAKMSPSCTQMMNEIDQNDDYSDWNIHEMVNMAGVADENAGKVSAWASGNETYMKLDSDTRNKICKAISCSSNSSLKDYYLFKGANGSLVMLSSSGLHLPESDGKCYTKNYSVKTEIPCYSQSNVVASFSSAADFNNKIVNGNQGTQKCLERLKQAEALRGNRGTGSGFIGYRAQAENALSILGGADTMCECAKDSEGNLTDKIDPEKGCKSLQETVEENLEETCPRVSEYQAQLGSNCLTCGLMATILGAAQKISEQAFVAISGDLRTLLGIAFLIYIAYTVLLTVASPETQKLTKLLNSLLMQGARVAIAVLILSYPEYLYSKVINPILDGAVDFGLAFSNVKQDGSGSKEIDVSIAEQIQTQGAEYTQHFNGQGQFLSTSTLEKLVGANKNFSKEAALMPALGRCLICYSTHDIPSGKPHFGIIPRIKMLITGVILLVFGVVIWLAVGFYILDCCLQLCLVTAMMSFFVACWPFKLTNSYVKVGWNMFLNIFFNFVMMSVVIVTIALLTGQAVNAVGMVDNINNNNLDQIENDLEVIGLGIIIMVVVCLICVKLGRESGRLANKFAGGAQIKMGADLGGTAASAVTQGTKSAMKATGKGLGKVGGSIAESSGLKGAATAAKQGLKETFGGGTKSKSASFKQNNTTNKGGDDKGGKEGGNDKGGKEGGEESPESGGNE